MMSHWKRSGNNFLKNPRTVWKYKQNLPKPARHNEKSSNWEDDINDI